MSFSKAAPSFLSVLILICFTACQNTHHKVSTTTGNLDLKKEISQVYASVNDPAQFNFSTCVSFSNDVYKDVLEISPARFEIAKTQENWKEIYEKLWNIRTKFRQKFAEFSTIIAPTEPALRDCAKSLHEGQRLSRAMEDYILENFSGLTNASPQKSFAFSGESTAATMNSHYGRVKIRSGDVILSRDLGVHRSALARLADPDSQFSQSAFVYITGDGKGQEYTIEDALENPRVFVIEASPELGSTIRPFKEFAADPYARHALYRFNDSLMAHRTAHWAYDYVQNFRKNAFDGNPLYPPSDVNYSVPFNFQLSLENPQNPKKLFSPQLIFVGYQNNNTTVPMFPSTLNPQISLGQFLGAASGPTLSPDDFESDPRFELIAEYRDLRKLPELRLQDMALSALFKWMNHGYEIVLDEEATLKTSILWMLKQSPSKISKIQMPRGKALKILASAYTLGEITKILEKELEKEDAVYRKSVDGLPMGYNQGAQFLETVLSIDKNRSVSSEPDRFHSLFKQKK